MLLRLAECRYDHASLSHASKQHVYYTAVFSPYQVENLEKLYGAQLIWKIDNYAEKLQDAKSGKKTTIYSPPFLTSRHGYKMALSLCLYGDGKSKHDFSLRLNQNLLRCTLYVVLTLHEDKQCNTDRCSLRTARWAIFVNTNILSLGFTIHITTFLLTEIDVCCQVAGGTCNSSCAVRSRAVHVTLRLHLQRRLRRTAAVAVQPQGDLHLDRPVPGPGRPAQRVVHGEAEPVQGEQAVPGPAARRPQRLVRRAEVRRPRAAQDARLHPRRHHVHQSAHRLRRYGTAVEQCRHVKLFLRTLNVC